MIQMVAQKKARPYNGRILAEFSAVPSCVLVHDPVAAGAFTEMRQVRDNATLERKLLFRERPDEADYSSQHQTLVSILREHVPTIYLSELIDNQDFLVDMRTNPNQVFTRDSLITIPWIPDRYIPARLKPAIRRPETQTMEAAVQQLGLKPILGIPQGLYLEGGDLVPYVYDSKRTLLIGFGPRTSFTCVRFLQQALVPKYVDEIIGVHLAPYRMNLDGGFLPVAEDVLIVDPESILGGIVLNQHETREIDVLGMFRDFGIKLIETGREESVFCQSCNCICLGGRKIIVYDLCQRVSRLLLEQDVEVLHIPGSELVKGRGGPRCMTRPLYLSDEAIRKLKTQLRPP